MSRAIIARLILTSVICLAVFKVSFSHIVAVAIRYGNSADDAILYPICIDAVILVSALYLSANKGVSRMTKLWARSGRWFGFAATIFCNVSHSDFESSMAVVIALIPAVSLIITVELLIHGSKATAATRGKKSTTAPNNVTQIRKSA